MNLKRYLKLILLPLALLAGGSALAAGGTITLTLSQSSVLFTPLTTEPVAITVTGSGKLDNFSVNSGNTKVATVASSKVSDKVYTLTVTRVAAGTTTITVSAKNVTASISVTVTDEVVPIVEAVSIDMASSVSRSLSLGLDVYDARLVIGSGADNVSLSALRGGGDHRTFGFDIYPVVASKTAVVYFKGKVGSSGAAEQTIFEYDITIGTMPAAPIIEEVTVEVGDTVETPQTTEPRSGYAFSNEALPDRTDKYTNGDIVTRVTAGAGCIGTPVLSTYPVPRSDGKTGYAASFTVAAVAEGKAIIQVGKVKRETGAFEKYQKIIIINVIDPAIRISKPTVEAGLVYTGAEQTGVVGADGFTLTGNVATNAGEYVAVATLVDGYCWDDGSEKPVEIAWSIARKAATVSVAAGQVKDVGSDEPVLEVTAEGLVASDPATYVWKAWRDPGEEIGTYAVHLATEQVLGTCNYDFTFVGGTFEIVEPSPLAVVIEVLTEDESYEAAVAKVEVIVGDEETQIAPQELADWISGNAISSAALVQSDYIVASANLGARAPITTETEVELVEVAADQEEGFTFKIELTFEGEVVPEVVKAVQEKVAGYIQVVDDLGDGFAETIDPERVSVDLQSGRVMITPDPTKTSEFFRISLPTDPTH